MQWTQLEEGQEGESWEEGGGPCLILFPAPPFSVFSFPSSGTSKNQLTVNGGNRKTEAPTSSEGGLLGSNQTVFSEERRRTGASTWKTTTGLCVWMCSAVARKASNPVVRSDQVGRRWRYEPCLSRCFKAFQSVVGSKFEMCHEIVAGERSSPRQTCVCVSDTTLTWTIRTSSRRPAQGDLLKETRLRRPAQGDH